MAGRWNPPWARRGKHTRTRVHRCRPARAAAAVAFAAGATAAPFGLTTATGADSPEPLHVVRATDAGELGLADVSGVSRDSLTGELLVTGISSAGRPTTVGISALGEVSDKGTLAGDYAGDGVAYDPAAGELVAVQGDELVVAGSGDTQTDLARLGVTRVGGIEYGPDGSLLVLDSQSRSIVTVPTGAQPGQVTETPLESAPASLESLAYNPADQQLYSADSSAGEVHSYALDGTRTGTFDLAGTGVRTVTSMEFAPTPDTTDDPAATSLFLTDASGGGGQVLELSATAAVATTASTTATLVRETDLSSFDPPSPDSAGITYVPNSDQPLLITDCEVDEMPLYAGFNVFRAGLDGTQGSNGDTTHYTIEPTGVSYNAADGHILVSDDDRNEVYDVAPGPDGVPGTSDDTFTSFDTGSSGNGDAEGVAVGPGGDLYVVDGVNKEVYVYSSGGSYLRQFDVAVHGAQDPEGIAYDAGRDTVLVLDQASRSVYEVTLAGQLVNTIDIASASTKKAAGITLAPPSAGGAGMNLYIVARGVDNNTNPAENDGKLFEMSTSSPPIGNMPPVVDAGPDMTTVLGNGAVLTGDVSDDGLPSASLTSTWTNQSPATGSVTFGDPGEPSTSATFSAAGTYVLRLTGDDGEKTSFDEVVVEVAPPGTPLSLDVAVTSSSDDAEEKPSGSMRLSGADLELVTDRGSIQTIGLRFAGVPLPHGASITNAYVQFTVDEVSTGATSLAVRGQAADNARTFTTAGRDVSSRPTTNAQVNWSPAPWDTKGASGAAQQTPDLSSVVQEVTNRPGWSSGNALVLVVTGGGTRTAEAFDGTAAPVLHIEYQVGGGTPANTAPVVLAGFDQTTVLGSGATLDGSVSDDGKPGDGSLSSTWRQVSGPGPVQFADPTEPSTTATFDQPGTHVLELEATDGVLTSTDRVAVDVLEPGSDLVLDLAVAQGSDDAEERVSNGSVGLGSGDLELGFDRSREQVVGLRFAGVTVPPGATITDAYVQFTVDALDSSASTLTVHGQAADDGATFQAVANDVSRRATTSASVPWSPPAWTAKGVSGADQRTPGLAAVLQEIVDRPGWASGNAAVLVVRGNGERTAEAFEGGKPAVLHIEYQIP